MRLVFEDQGWEDYTSWLKTDRKMLARINRLIEDTKRDPDDVTGGCLDAGHPLALGADDVGAGDLQDQPAPAAARHGPMTRQ